MIRPTLSLVVSLAILSPVSLHAQQFGGSVAISSDQILVSETGNTNLPGVVYVYARDGDSWREIAQLMVSDDAGPPDGFGSALAADGERLLVGAPAGGGGAGVAHLFRRANTSPHWTAVGRLIAADGAKDDNFGSSVVLDGDVALIAAPGHNEGAGAVYVFARGADRSWRQQAKLVAEDSKAGRRFGSTLAKHGNAVLVASADQRDIAGAVYAFRWDANAGDWVAESTLEVSGLDARSGYGSALALGEGVAFVGAPNLERRVGAVFAFPYNADSTRWESPTRLSPFEARTNARFGSSITLAESGVLIGAPGASSGTGLFYHFEHDAAGDWTRATKVKSETLDGRAAFASAAAVRQGLLVAGALGVDSRAGAAVVMERDDAGIWRERSILINEMRGLPSITGAEVECTDSRAAGFECSNVNIVSFLPIKDIGGVRGTRVNDIWGWTDSETGREYAIVGRTDGTSFIDVSDPYRPVFVADLPKTEGSRSSIWRDMKVYRDHVYIVADAANEHGVQVFDLTTLRSIARPPMTVTPTHTYHGIHSAHNIVINETTGYAYAVGNSGGGETCGGGLHMMNLENPTQPTFAGCFFDTSTGRRKTGYSHDAQCVAYHGPDRDYQGREICLGSNETALSISDVTDKENPIAVAAVSYPNVAYTHQGWLTEDHRYFYMNDEGDEPQGLVEGTRTLVWDVTDLDDPVLIKEHIASTKTTDHNLYIKGNLMYQSNYGSGLRILDISDPANPVEIGFFDTTPYGGSGSWSNYPYFESGVVVATSTGDGVFVLKSASRPTLVP